MAEISDALRACRTFVIACRAEAKGRNLNRYEHTSELLLEIDAALIPRPVEAGVPKVKALEWQEILPREFMAKTICGQYSILGVTANENHRLYFRTQEIKSPDGNYWPLEAAKMAAQSDYTARILSVLDLPTSPATGDEG